MEKDILKPILIGVSILVVTISGYFYLNRPPAVIPVKTTVQQNTQPESLPDDNTPMLTEKNIGRMLNEHIAESSIPNSQAVTMQSDVAEIRSAALKKADERDLESALSMLKGIADKYPPALVDIGIIYINMEKFDEAIRFLDKAVQSGIDGFFTKKAYAVAYYKKNDLKKALEYAQQGVRIKFDNELQALCDRIAREIETQRGFISEGTSHFVIVFDGYSNGYISRKVLGFLEDAYRTISADLNVPDAPTTVILYTNRDFYDVTGAPFWAGGEYDLYDGKIRVPIRGAETTEAVLKTVLFHEYVHAVVGTTNNRLPHWFREGLAEYYAKRGSRTIGQVVPLSRLEQSFAGVDTIMAYQESYSAVSCLIDRYGAYRIKSLIAEVSKGKDFKKAFGEILLPYDEFLSKWDRS